MAFLLSKQQTLEARSALKAQPLGTPMSNFITIFIFVLFICSKKRLPLQIRKLRYSENAWLKNCDILFCTFLIDFMALKVFTLRDF